jgi:hypothetical protein
MDPEIHLSPMKFIYAISECRLVNNYSGSLVE